MSIASRRLAAAHDFAVERHAGQLRKGTDLPYVVHPIGVAELCLTYYPDNVNLGVAAYLHDTVEDTDTTLAEIEASFGSAVAALVDAATARRGRSWRETRSNQIAKLGTAELDAVRLKAADATHNAESIGADRAAAGDSVFDRFAASTNDVRWYYRGLLSEIRARLGSEPLVERLAAAVADLEADYIPVSLGQQVIERSGLPVHLDRRADEIEPPRFVPRR